MDTTNRNESLAAAPLTRAAAAQQLADAGCDVDMLGIWWLNGMSLAFDSREALVKLRAAEAIVAAGGKL
jgi:hypothetical protein